MKMKRVTLGFSILAVSTLFLLSCDKKANVAPEPDTEVKSAINAAYATYIATDVDMICGFMGENLLNNHFYIEYPGSSGGGTGTMTAVRDTNGTQDQLVMGFNKTKCLDGRVRDGSIFMQFNTALKPGDLKVNYTRSYQFKGVITFSEYKVDGWLIKLLKDSEPVYLYNTISSATINPLVTNLTWRFVGNIKMIHPTDTTKNIIWKGDLTKVLTNTNDKLVYPPSGKAAITWSLAVVNYYGKITGSVPKMDENDKVLASAVPFSMTIDPATPLVRDFQCYPDKIAGVAFTNTAGVLVQRTEEYHPFKKGVASFTVGTDYPRQIYFGNEGNPLLELQCDNTGEVLIKGISYRVNFIK